MAATDTSTLLEEVKSRTRELFALLRSSGELGKDAARAIEKAASEAEERLRRSERAILLAGESEGRHRVLDALLGERVFAAAQRETRAATRLRRGDVIDYEAKLRGGGVERFHQSVPAREEAFAKAIARAAGERSAAEEGARAVAAAIDAEQRRAKTLLIEPETAGRRFRALLAWLAAWIQALFSRGARPAALPEAAPTPDTRARDAAASVEKAAARQATLEAERDRYAVERRASFFAALRALVDDLSRGGEVVELTIDVPGSGLPAGVFLLNAPELRSYEEVDGCLLVTATPEQLTGPVDALGPRACRAIAPGAPAAEVWSAVEGLRRTAPLLAGEKAVSLARRSIGGAVEDGSRAAEVCRGRIAALEGQRLTDPAEFRGRSLARMEKAIDDGARDVLRAAVERLPPAIEKIKSDWRARLLACADRREIEECVQSIRDSAPAWIGALVDETNEFVVAEVQRASDTMQIWVLEEIHARYQVARRASASDGSAPVITDAGAGELVALDGAPFADAMEAFEQGRVGYGLGGAAAGAVLGTLIAPVVGTAIGAFLGVFAGLLKGIESLRQDCLTKLEACVDECGEQIRVQLEARHAGLAGALRASLEEALDLAMQRFERSITRLLQLEAKTLAAEREKLARLAALRVSLEAHEARFASLADQARARLPP